MALRQVMPYYMKDEVSEQRDENRLVPNREATFHDLAKVGVELIQIQMNDQWELHLQKLAKLYGMAHSDLIKISVCMEAYEKKIKMFFEEHLHKDAELRFIVKGSGFFDIRSAEDLWIRIPVAPGDFVYLPPGIYHRFTTDKKNMIEAMRFFQTTPSWEAYPRSTTGENQPERDEFLKNNGLKPSS